MHHLNFLFSTGASVIRPIRCVGPMGGILLLVVGCAFLQEQAVKQAALDVEAIPAETFNFTNIEVTKEGTLIAVSGNLRHSHRLTGGHQHPGNVEVSVIDDKGVVVATTEVPYRLRYPHAAVYDFSATINAASAARIRLMQHLSDSDDDPHDDPG